MASVLKTILVGLIDDILRGISGPLGIRLRRAYYKHRFRQCGDGLVIEAGVHIVGADWISLGSHVWIDRFAILIAGPTGVSDRIEERGSRPISFEGHIQIGNHAHVGIGTIIQGHGGVSIGSGFTSSPHVKIYSLSNDYKKCRYGTVDKPETPAYYIKTPVRVGDNVWLGLNTVVIGHKIGSNSFIKPNSVVSTDVAENSVVAGMPAKEVGHRFDGSAFAV